MKHATLKTAHPEARLKIQKAGINLLCTDPFFGAIDCGLRMIEDPTIDPPTMCTNGYDTIRWHPALAAAEDPSTLKTVIAHECLHVVSLHAFRQGAREHDVWNQACDHEANLAIEKINKAAEAKGRCRPYPAPESVTALMDPRFEGQSAEQIYDILILEKNQGGGNNGQQGSQPPGGGQGKGKPRMGDVRPDPADQATQTERQTRKLIDIQNAREIARQQGHLPAGFDRLIDDLLEPKAPWQDLLRQFLTARAADDYAWHRPNRRYLASGFILPSLYSQRLGPIAIAVDTSGSITPDLLNTVLAEVEAIAHQCRPEKIILLDCDATVHSIRECQPTDPLPRDFRGGGGTSFVPVFDALESDPPVALIYFTDLCGDFPDTAPAYPTLWVTQDDTTAPFGQTIRL